MIGNNHLTLCQSEMINALQQYLDDAFVCSPGKVTRVSQDESGVSFTITITEEEKS